MLDIVLCIAQAAPMPKPKLPELVPTAEVARRLGCDVRTVHRMVAAGRLSPVTKLPGRTGPYLFDAAEVSSLREAVAS